MRPPRLRCVFHRLAAAADITLVLYAGSGPGTFKLGIQGVESLSASLPSIAVDSAVRLLDTMEVNTHAVPQEVQQRVRQLLNVSLFPYLSAATGDLCEQAAAAQVQLELQPLHDRMTASPCLRRADIHHERRPADTAQRAGAVQVAPASLRLRQHMCILACWGPICPASEI